MSALALTALQKYSLRLHFGLVEVALDAEEKPLTTAWKDVPDGSELFAAVEPPVLVCNWKESNVLAGAWTGDCKVVWELLEGNPAENAMNFCPSCGRPLVVAEAVPTKDPV